MIRRLRDSAPPHVFYTLFTAKLSVAEEEAGEAGEAAAEEMRGEDRAEDAEKEIEECARARQVGKERKTNFMKLTRRLVSRVRIVQK